ncbi:hypothetical protein Pmani_022789 [Petrolisthes manimaculis]|uniref:Uncharacterized protein n=1 Tax=Petrolisthes manimaculis TaxID=1843537 RepID=A0AAE1U401_9EUCA|nr:hypothetical protein Pmani_022789 [Petrolisthes manimaculis]
MQDWGRELHNGTVAELLDWTSAADKEEEEEEEEEDDDGWEEEEALVWAELEWEDTAATDLRLGGVTLRFVQNVCLEDINIPRGLDVPQGRLRLDGREQVEADSLTLLEPNGGTCDDDAAANETDEPDTDVVRACMRWEDEVSDSSGK